jgi:hypothetical protein
MTKAAARRLSQRYALLREFAPPRYALAYRKLHAAV